MYFIGERSALRATLVVLGVLLGQFTSRADIVTFDVVLGEEVRGATTQLVDMSGVRYLSLNSLVEQLQGGCRLMPTRVQVDLGGDSAWIELNDTEVNASIDTFQLRHPVLRRNDEAFIALLDVRTFIEKAFRGQTTQSLALDNSGNRGAATETESHIAGRTPLRNRYAGRPIIEIVAIDPGHGGEDPGGIYGEEMNEKSITLSVARALAERLATTLSVKTVLTREEDLTLSDRERANVATVHEADLLISIHTGASYSPSAHGFELFYPSVETNFDSTTVAAEGMRGWDRRGYTLQSRDVARAIGIRLGEATGADNRGEHEVRARVLRLVAMPAVVVEIGCLTNTTEAELLMSADYQTKIAQGIATGIYDYVNGTAPEPAAP